MMATVQDEKAELFAKNQAANKVFHAKENAILVRQATAAEKVQATSVEQRFVSDNFLAYFLLSNSG